MNRKADTKMVKAQAAARGLPRQLLRAAGWVIAAASLFPALAHAQSEITRTSSFEYDANGLLIKEVVEPDSANDCLSTSYTYDARGNKTATRTAACAGASGDALLSATAARSTGVQYSAQTVTVAGQTLAVVAGQFATRVSNALNQAESRTFDPRFGVMLSLTGPNGLTTRWEYDSFGRKTKEVRADGTYGTWAYQYCDTLMAGGVACPQMHLGNVVSYVFTQSEWGKNNAKLSADKITYLDAFGRVLRVQTVDFKGKVVVQDSAYNALGQLSWGTQSYLRDEESFESYKSEQFYDALGRVLSQTSNDPTAPEGKSTISTVYDGLTVTVTNPKGQTRTTVKNILGQTQSVTDHDGKVVRYSYDALGQLMQTDAAGQVTRLTYDRRGRKVQMNDPSMGVWTYAYNVFGELVRQTDSLGQVSTMAYDVLGRMVQRSEPDLVSNWYYEKNASNVVCNKAVGKLCEARSNNGYQRVHSYDSLGRLVSTQTKQDSTQSLSEVSASYDANTGRQRTQSWPNISTTTTVQRYTATYTYNAGGYLTKVAGAGGGVPSATLDILDYDSQGRITSYKQGGKITTNRTYEAVTGRLLGIAAQVDGQAAGSLFKQSYSYDSLSNLVEKRDAYWDPVKKANLEVTDSYTYDNLNRLSTYTTLGGGVATPSTVQVVYDARGNIVYKSDVGRYWYDINRPNRLVQVTLEGFGGAQALTGTRAMSYAFDDYMSGAKQGEVGVPLGNGNLMYTVSQDSVSKRHTLRWETYTSFNMPKEVKYASLGSTIMSTAADRTLSFTYGPEHQRVKQVVKLETNAPTSLMGGTTWYLHGSNNSLLYEKEVKANGVTEHRHYLQAAGMTVALAVVRSGTGVSATHANVRMRPTQLTYYQQDHLGSIAVVTDANGAVLERMAYDPWGKRRFTTGLADKNDSIVGVNTDRGYTEHEHLDEMGVIHMNGRLYDPLVGRFMSADPFIQSPENLQSYNRFSYVMNNPLAYTDPSGYWSWRKFIRAAVMITAAVYLGPLVTEALFSAAWAAAGTMTATQAAGMYIASAAVGGAVAGYVGGYMGVIATGGNSAEARAAGKSGAISGALFGAAGGVNAFSSVAGYAAHATAGCLSAVSGDGNCGRGAWSAIFGKFTTNATAGMDLGDGVGGSVARGAAAMVAGGVGSVIAGGKFANGAETAAYGYLFNEMLTDKQGRSFKSRGRYYRGDQTLGGFDSGSCLCSADPPTPSESYEGFKYVAALARPLMVLTTIIDTLVIAVDFYSGNTAGGALGVGSAMVGKGVELMATPLGGLREPLGHLSGIGYDNLAK